MPSTTEVVCGNAACQKLFRAQTREVARGNGKFCSRTCAGATHGEAAALRAASRATDVVCALCDRTFKIGKAARLRQSKSGLYFCCRAHKDAAQRIGGIEAIHPTHYNGGSASYRDVAFRIFGATCMSCGYARIRDVLHVHHLDGNRKHNTAKNLCILCPTCHTERHYFIRMGAMSHADPMTQMKKIKVR